MSTNTQALELIWVDLETTGLDPEKHVPLELAFVITNADLEIVEERSLVFHHQIILNDLDPWVRDTHTNNGLLLEVVASKTTRDDTDRMLRNICLNRYRLGDDKPPLCGSSINFERTFLSVYFPEFYNCLSYRSVDVSSLKELMKRWRPEDAISRTSTSRHRALDDIRDSIDELRHYREVLNWR